MPLRIDVNSGISTTTTTTTTTTMLDGMLITNEQTPFSRLFFNCLFIEYWCLRICELSLFLIFHIEIFNLFAYGFFLQI